MKTWIGCVFGVVLSGCVSKSTHQQVADERDQFATRIDELEKRVQTLEKERDTLDANLQVAQERVREFTVRERGPKVQQTRKALGLGPGEKVHATLKTRLGDIRCELWPDIAPVTVRNFVDLAQGKREWTDPRDGRVRTEPLYNGTVFHRVLPEFMIQGGDPMGNGRGGPGYSFEDEIHPDAKFDKPGRLAMANAGPGTNGSQFFITDSTPAHLNGRHTIFGECDVDVVRAIMAEPLERSPDNPRERSKPVNAVAIERVVISTE